MNALRFLSQQADNHSSKSTPSRPSILWLVMMILVLGQSNISAQIACYGNVEIGFGPWCKVNLSPSQFIAKPSGEYTFLIVGSGIQGTLPFEVVTSQITLNQT